MSSRAPFLAGGEVQDRAKPGVRFLVVVDGREFELDQVRAQLTTSVENPEQSILNLAAALSHEAAVAIMTAKRR
jgi:hypothetical protein